MKVSIGCFYKHIPTGHIKKVVFITRDGDHIRFNDNAWVNKDDFDKYWKEVDNDDRVNHPSYYQDPSGVECIDVVRHRDFDIGSAMKYLWRAGLKKEEGISNTDKQVEDLKKAIFYINDEIKLIKKKQNDRKS